MNTQSIAQAEAMKIDPRELVIDMPLDDKNVQVKIESLRQSGMVQPVTLWLQDNRIIDGFHRTAAACLLGWQEIDVWVRDCDEEAFWDARIQSARQHHTIEDARLAAWMVQCWRATEFQHFDPEGDGREVGEAVWLILWKHGRQGKPHTHNLSGDRLLNDAAMEAVEWLRARAEQWGISVEELGRKVIGQYGLRPDFENSKRDRYDDWSMQFELDFEQRKRLQAEIPISPGVNGQPRLWEAEEFIKEKIVPEVEDGEGYYQFVARKRRDRMKKQEAETARLAAAQPKRHPLVDLAAQQEKERQEATRYCRQILAECRRWIRDLENKLVAAPDGHELFASYVEDMVATHNRLWSESPTPQLNSELARLERRVRELTSERDSLKRALESKSRVSVSSVAISGSELARMKA